MLIGKKVMITLVLTAMVLFLGACGGSKLKLEPIAKSENPTELVNRLDKDIANARKDQVNVLSPTWFAKAEMSLREAKQGIEQGDKISKILNSISQGQAQLNTANDKSKVARSNLAEVIKGRSLARTAGATELVRDYAKVEENFLELTKAIEKGNLRYAKKNRAGVQEEFRRLELLAIKIRTLGEVRKLLDQARRNGDHKIAPKSYAVAQKRLEESDAFITKNPYKKEEMHEKASLALFMAQRVHEVARQSTKIEDMAPEQITLMFEENLHKIAQKLSAQDMRNQPFETQVENIVGTIAALQHDRTFMIDIQKSQREEIDTLKERLAKLAGQSQAERDAKERLLAERRFNELFNTVQGYFEPYEAETYKMGNQLVIRLKGIHFPVGKSVILPQNYKLLSKVQRSIRTLGDVDVVIEGHSDSTGSAELNEHLSEQRADAVRQYLVANETLTYDKIIAVGYGSIRPIASNKTAEGRALNRRIDLIITPHFKFQK
ncbi:MAG: OmpA family protein [Deltaproteobacteria bacterium]|nr:MAG: OmpA family protein [Deltaproteobacteria bacterium]